MVLLGIVGSLGQHHFSPGAIGGHTLLFRTLIQPFIQLLNHRRHISQLIQKIVGLCLLMLQNPPQNMLGTNIFAATLQGLSSSQLQNLSRRLRKALLSNLLFRLQLILAKNRLQHLASCIGAHISPLQALKGIAPIRQIILSTLSTQPFIHLFTINDSHHMNGSLSLFTNITKHSIYLLLACLSWPKAFCSTAIFLDSSASIISSINFKSICSRGVIK